MEAEATTELLTPGATAVADTAPEVAPVPDPLAELTQPPVASEGDVAPAPDPMAGLESHAEADDEMSEEEEPEEAIPRVIALGVMDMDKKLGGGLSLNTVTLVEGDPEAGKSVVVQQLMYGALKEGLRAGVFLSECTARELMDSMETLGMPVMDYYLVGRLSLFQSNLRVDQERAEQMTRNLLKFVEKGDKYDLLIVDSITPLLFQFDARFVLSFLATCKELAELGRTIIVTLHSYAINESLRLRAGSIVDAHLKLSIEELGGQVVRTLEVSKIRGATKTVGNSVSFSVATGLGLKSIPISKTKA